MGTDYGVNLLAYALPVLRLLGLRQIQVPFPEETFYYEAGQAIGCTPTLSEGLPEGLGSLLSQARTGISAPAVPPLLVNRAPLLVNVPDGSYSLDNQESTVCLGVIPSSPPENDESAPDRALCELLRAVHGDEVGHLLVADWLEEWLGPCPLAAALRASSSQLPGSLAQSEQLVYHSFGWRWLDRDAMLYLAGVLRRDHTRRQSVRGGFLIGVIYRADGAPRRWVRWHSVETPEAVRPLARELGVELID